MMTAKECLEILVSLGYAYPEIAKNVGLAPQTLVGIKTGRVETPKRATRLKLVEFTISALERERELEERVDVLSSGIKTGANHD